MHQSVSASLPCSRPILDNCLSFWISLCFVGMTCKYVYAAKACKGKLWIKNGMVVINRCLIDRLSVNLSLLLYGNSQQALSVSVILSRKPPMKARWFQFSHGQCIWIPNTGVLLCRSTLFGSLLDGDLIWTLCIFFLLWSQSCLINGFFIYVKIKVC